MNETVIREPKEVLEEIKALDEESAEILKKVAALV
jgi:hypothetical protein